MEGGFKGIARRGGSGLRVDEAGLLRREFVSYLECAFTVRAPGVLKRGGRRREMINDTTGTHLLARRSRKAPILRQWVTS